MSERQTPNPITAENSNYIIYTPVKNGQAISPNGNYILPSEVTLANVDESSLAEGDFISFATDYNKRSKTIKFSSPVIFDDVEYADGIVQITGRQSFRFIAGKWTNSFNSEVVLMNRGSAEFETSGTFNLRQLANIDPTADIFLCIDIVAGGGPKRHTNRVHDYGNGHQATYNYYCYGGAGAGARIEFVDLVDNEDSAIDYQLGAIGGASSLTINGESVLNTIAAGEGGTSCRGGQISPLDVDESKILRSVVFDGVDGEFFDNYNESNMRETADSLNVEGQIKVSTPFYEVSNGSYPEDNNGEFSGTVHYHGSRSASLLMHNGIGFGGGDTPGAIVISYRVATPEEVAAQKTILGIVS